MKDKLILLFCLVVVPACSVAMIIRHMFNDPPPPAADHRAESAVEYRQALTAACFADGGEPIVGEQHVTCLRKWAQQGETLVLWSRRKTP